MGKNKKKPLVYISYATKDTPYVDELNTHLLPTLKKFDLNYDIEYPANRGNWQANTGYKSEFILKMLEKHKRPVIFLDADAEIWKYPGLFENISNKYDLGVHILDWGWVWHKKHINKKELLSGTMYIPYKEKTLEIIKEWIIEVKDNSSQWEQRVLHNVVDNHPELYIFHLPFEYITFPNHKNELPLHAVKKEDVVIYHTQASRRLKNWRANENR